MAVGVDLFEYGLKEKAIHARISKAKPLCISSPPSDNFDLLDFTIGPTPSDWRLSFREHTDCFAAEFWSLIERPEEELMPGTWID